MNLGAVIDRKSELEVVVMNYAVEMHVVQQREEEEGRMGGL